MPRGQRRTRPEFWIGLIFVALLAYALIADWWEEHAVLGWVIVGIVVAILVFSIFRFQAFRSWLSGRARKAGESIIYETTAVSGREPLPENMRTHILQRAGYKCENPDCRSDSKPEIHHIDNDNSNNSPRNLIALCHACHKRAHDDYYSNSQLRNWVQRSWATFKRNR